MTQSDLNPQDAQPTASFDGCMLDCGSGLLLLIRKHIDPLLPGQLLEIFSAECSVREDLPAWCRLTGNALVTMSPLDDRTRFLIVKGDGASATRTAMARVSEVPRPQGATIPDEGGPQAAWERTRAAEPRADVGRPVPTLAPFSVMGIGSWPRPRWLLPALHDYVAGRLDERSFQEIADDSVRLMVQAQQRAGVDVLSDGEQRRDDYASFVGNRLENCQLIPLTDLLAFVDHPEEFAAALKQLDVPADKIRHPAVWGRLSRPRPLALHELQFLQGLTDQPLKIALPGPYLLTRTMWMECISDRTYASREELADDLVLILRQELAELLAAGAALVQFDEPVLTEAVYGRTASGNRTFMCGALGHKAPLPQELQFAEQLICRVLAGFPPERVALHVCRGNWTSDESAALAGDYRPLIELLSRLPVGTLFLELCTPRAGDWQVLADLPQTMRGGVGVVNQKSPRVEAVDEIVERGEQAVRLLGAHRVLLNPDCGFATFADNPLTSGQVAEAKLAAIVAAAKILRARHG